MKRPRPPVTAPDFEELSCYLDGELAPERLAEIDRWLADHPDALQKLLKIRAAETELRAAMGKGRSTGPKA